MDYWRPYPAQLQFFATGKQFRERALFAGNQVGKSTALSYESALHLTGLYPEGWEGRRWDRPIRMWAVGESAKVVRDIIQRKLLGEPGSEEDFGAGMLPKHLILSDSIVMQHGEKHAIDTVLIRHVAGGTSTLKFRAFNQGRSALQGESLDLVWIDERPDAQIYSELLTRVSATGGQVAISFTALKGMSEIAARYRQEFSPDRTFIQYGINQIPPWGHIKPEERAAIIAGYPEHERATRNGFGSSRPNRRHRRTAA
jgi:phage terminase large subunit-like protein